MPRLPRLGHKALVRQANWKGFCLITGKQFFQNHAKFANAQPPGLTGAKAGKCPEVARGGGVARGAAGID